MHVIALDREVENSKERGRRARDRESYSHESSFQAGRSDAPSCAERHVHRKFGTVFDALPMRNVRPTIGRAFSARASSGSSPCRRAWEIELSGGGERVPRPT